LVTTLACVVTVVVLFLAQRDSGPDSIKRRAVTCTVVGAILLFVYFGLNTTCIFEKDGARVFTGFWLTDEAIARVRNHTADSFQRGDLLASFGYNHAGQIWYDAWLVNLAINCSFLLAFVALSAGVFMFVLRESRIAAADLDTINGRSVGARVPEGPSADSAPP